MDDVLIPMEILGLVDSYGDKEIKANYLKLDKNGDLKKEEIRVIPNSTWDISEYAEGFKYIKGFWLSFKIGDNLRVLSADEDMTDMDDCAKDNIVDDILGAIDYERERKIKWLDSMVCNYLDIRDQIEEGKIQLP